MVLQRNKNCFLITCLLRFFTADESDLSITVRGHFALLFCCCFYVESRQPISVSLERHQWLKGYLLFFFQKPSLPVCLLDWRREGEREKLKGGRFAEVAVQHHCRTRYHVKHHLLDKYTLSLHLPLSPFSC